MVRKSRLYKSVLKLQRVSNDPSCAVTTSTLGASPDNDVFPQAVLSDGGLHAGDKCPRRSSERPFGSTCKSLSLSAKYNFGYEVVDPESGNDFGHSETRNGDNTSGQFRVLLPDGRVQVVTYTVNGDSGYVAQVAYQ
ncbi:uncharacterized protein LOC134769386 [Penaeus indicus]|uniref:uncharacterized protein LOC134769386 n=1 Tax=Penaeus indicus TaxID=29960 RepID=UPI00300D1077